VEPCADACLGAARRAAPLPPTRAEGSGALMLLTVGALPGPVDANTYSGTVPAQTVPEQDVRVEEQASTDDPWVTIVWNDPVNLMTYVSYVFQSYFGYPASKAERLMRQVHEEGRAVVSTGNREQMETDVQAMHGFGLWATLQQGGR
jgi:ATP-dependent Clp protease adaptor protein ClpS